MLGLGSSVSKRGGAGSTVVTDGLVLKHNYDRSAVEPVSSGAASFEDSNNDTVSIPDDNSLSFDACSFSAWIWMDDATNFKSIAKGVLNSTWEYLLGTESDDKMYFFIADESVASCYLGRKTAALTSREKSWVHVAATYDGGTVSTGIKIYIDGVQSDTGTAVESNAGSFVAMENLGANLQLGRYSSTTGTSGYMCNVGAWNAVLTQPQIKSIMHKDYAALSASEKDDLVSWWNLDSVIPDSTTLVYDNHHGGGEILGGEELNNGQFTELPLGTGWTPNEWVIAGGKATLTNASATTYLVQSGVFDSDKLYEVSFNVLSFSGGPMYVRHGAITGTAFYSAGVHTEQVTGSAGSFYLRANAGVSAVVENISVKEINGNTGTLA